MVGSRVYVGGLPYGVRERDLERFFKGYGRTRDILIKNGYGFVVSTTLKLLFSCCFIIRWILRGILQFSYPISAHVWQMFERRPTGSSEQFDLWHLLTHSNGHLMRCVFSFYANVGIRRLPWCRRCSLWTQWERITRRKVNIHSLGNFVYIQNIHKYNIDCCFFCAELLLSLLVGKHAAVIVTAIAMTTDMAVVAVVAAAADAITTSKYISSFLYIHPLFLMHSTLLLYYDCSYPGNNQLWTVFLQNIVSLWPAHAHWISLDCREFVEPR